MLSDPAAADPGSCSGKARIPPGDGSQPMTL
jgi:hypothetical protein